MAHLGQAKHAADAGGIDGVFGRQHHEGQHSRRSDCCDPGRAFELGRGRQFRPSPTLPNRIINNCPHNIFSLDDGENINTDDRLAFAREAEAARGTVEVVHINIGAFLDRRVLFGFLGAFDLEVGQAYLWGDGHAAMDFTTYEDTTRFTAEVALDEEQVPAVFEVAGDTLTFHELVKAYEETSGKSITVVQKGSLADLDREIERRRQAEPQNVFAWLPLMYWRGMLSGKGKLLAIANDRYPSIRPLTVRDYVRRALTAKHCDMRLSKVQ